MGERDSSKKVILNLPKLRINKNSILKTYETFLDTSQQKEDYQRHRETLKSSQKDRWFSTVTKATREWNDTFMELWETRSKIIYQNELLFKSKGKIKTFQKNKDWKSLLLTSPAWKELLKEVLG